MGIPPFGGPTDVSAHHASVPVRSPCVKPDRPICCARLPMRKCSWSAARGIDLLPGVGAAHPEARSVMALAAESPASRFCRARAVGEPTNGYFA